MNSDPTFLARAIVYLISTSSLNCGISLYRSLKSVAPSFNISTMEVCYISRELFNQNVVIFENTVSSESFIRAHIVLTAEAIWFRNPLRDVGLLQVPTPLALAIKAVLQCTLVG